MSTYFNTPILFIIFNRPDTTLKVFDVIRKIKPKKLYVVADGPRQTKENENKICEQTRVIIESVDWECEIFKNYSDVNLGCKKRVSSGIDWFFSNEEEGIILEDDCLPEPSFFTFCEEMLEKYKHNERIGMITGDNFQFEQNRSEFSYYFSAYSHIWGWATWRRAWEKYDVSISSWPKVRESKKLITIFPDFKTRLYWKLIFDDIYNDKIDTWDYQWSYTCFTNNFLSVTPSVNLISNIGFNTLNSTHTKRKSKFANMKTQEILFPLSHPKKIGVNYKADNLIQKNNYPFVRFLIKRILRLLSV